MCVCGILLDGERARAFRGHRIDQNQAVCLQPALLVAAASFSLRQASALSGIEERRAAVWILVDGARAEDLLIHETETEDRSERLVSQVMK